MYRFSSTHFGARNRGVSLLQSALNLGLVLALSAAVLVPLSGTDQPRGPEAGAPAVEQATPPVDAADLQPVAAGVPAAGTSVYTETFETSPAGLSAPRRFLDAFPAFDAHVNWQNTTACNGIWIRGNSPVANNPGSNTTSGFSGCRYDTIPNANSGYAGIRSLATTLGDGDANNAAISSFTHNGVNPGANHVQLLSPLITLPSTDRFYSGAIDMAATSCGAAAGAYNPSLRFFVQTSGGATDSDATRTYLGGAVSGCPKGTGVWDQKSTLKSPGAIRWAAGGMRMGVINTTDAPSGTGDDSAVDNLAMVDTTPIMDKSFNPAIVPTNGVSTLTIRITNRDELASKRDWSFTDTLASGLTVAGAPSTTCVTGAVTDITTSPSATFLAGSVSAPLNGNTITATNLDLDSNMASCTITVLVRAAGEQTYTNGPSNITSHTFVDPPMETVTLTSRDPRITVTKALGSSRVKSGDQFTSQIRTGSTSGTVVSSATNATTTGTGNAVTAGTGTTGSYRLGASPSGTSTLPTLYLTEAAASGADLTRYNATITCTDAKGIQTGLPNGVALGTGFALDAQPGTDIGCVITNTAKAPTITVNKALGSIRALPADQFTTEIRTGSATGTVVSSATNATTTGSGSTVTAGTGTTGAYTGTAGTTYYVTESGASGANLNFYGKAITCVDAAGATSGLPTNQGFAGSAAITPGPGAVITCTITNTMVPPNLNISKSVLDATIDPATGGGTVRYTVNVTNGSIVPTVYGPVTDTPAFGAGATVTSISWTGQSSGSTTGSSATLAPLLPLTPLASSATHTWTVTVKYTGRPTTNTCTGAGTGLYNSVTLGALQETGTNADNSACIAAPTADPKLTIVKSASITTDVDNDGKADTGDVITYSFLVTNTGNVTVNGVSVSDPKVGAVTCSPTTLAPNASVTCTKTYTVSQTDVNAGDRITNVATASATPVGTTTPITSPPSTVNVPTDRRTSMTVVKNSTKVITDVDGNGPDAGDTIAYTFLVTNTGTTTISGIVVNDAKIPGPISCLATTLAPTATTTCSATYTITAADVAAGQVVNSATVTGNPPGGEPPVTSPPSTITVPVPQPPTARDDSTTTKQGDAVTLTPATNDTAVAGHSITATSLQLIDPSTGNPVTTVTVANQGTWTVQPSGQVIFTPVPGFTGDATPVQYRIADDQGATAIATLRVTVTPVVPVANPDTAFTPSGTAVNVPLLTNDNAGDPTAALVPNTTRLQDSSGAWVTSVTVPNQGTWAVNGSGVVTFTPVPGFAGTASLPYRVADENGTWANSTVTVTVGTAVVMNPNSATTPQNVNVTLTPTSNDTPGSTATWVPSSVVLRDPADTTFKKTVTTAEGTWTVNPDGTVTFDPIASYTGTTPTIDYRATDSTGLTGVSTLQVTVTPITPTAGNDRVSTPFRTAVTVPVLGNDSAGASSAPLDSSSVQLKDPADGTWKTTVTTAEGTYVVQAGGSVRFTPTNQFRGTTTPLDYRVADANGTRATATITVDVGLPATPKANPDSQTTPQGIATTVNPLTNDTKSTDNGDLVPSSVKLWDGDSWETSVTVSGEGTYTVNTTTGEVTFTPVKTFTGQASGVSYQVTDANGAQAESVITITVTPVKPAPVADTSTTPFATPVDATVLTNDKPGNPNVPLDPSTVTLLDENGDPASSVTVPGGEFTLDPATGVATFTPNVGFSGTAVVTYQVADANGTTATTTWTVTVGAPPAPALTPDANTTLQGVAVTTDVVANDDVTAAGGTLVPSSVQISDDGGLTWLSAGTLANRGTFSVNSSGAVVFTPFPQYVGTFTVDYRVADSYGTWSTSTLELTVTPVTPVAVDDSDTTPYLTPVTVVVVGNDTPGDPAVALVPTSVRLLDGTTPVTSLTVPGEGTWTVDTTTGEVTFSPDAGFTGPATPVDYRIADVNGTTATATISITVDLGPEAAPDTATTKQAVPVTVTPLGNDDPGTDGTWQTGTVQLLDPADGTWRKTVTTVQGAWTVNAGGTVSFAPVATFTGTTTPLTYRAQDSYDNTASSTITVTVTPITPDAVNDTATTPHATLVNVPVLTNDTAGDATAPLVAGSVRLVDPTTGTPVTTDVTTADGTWHVRANGSVDFTPVVGFTGVASLDYSVADANGTRDRATIQVTVAAGPSAEPDSTTTPQNVTVSLNPTTNDAAGPGGTLDVTSVRFTSPAATNGGRTLVAPEGTWTIDPATGVVTFDPVQTFTGTPPSIGYRVTDSYGNTAASTVTITVTPITPVADNDSDTTPFQTPVTVNVLAGDTPGAASAPLVPSSVRLIDPDNGTEVTSVTTNQGVWTVQPDGRITFDPADGFTGTTTPVSYVVRDTNGTVSNPAEVTVDVLAGPSATADSFTTLQGVASDPIDVLGNDTPSVRATWNTGSVVFTSPDATDGGKTLVVANEGTWTVKTDGTVVFTPVPAFTGAVTPVTYRATDSLGNTATAVITGTVTGVTPAPVPDTARTPYLTPVTFDVAGNDQPGDASAPIVPGSVKLVDGTTLVDTLTTSDGVWAVASNGRLTFTPADGFSGNTAAVTYSVADDNGTRATTTAVVTVGTPPRADDDSATTPQNTPVTVDVLDGDVAGSGIGDGATVLNPDSVKLIGPGTSADGKTRTVTGEGVWTVKANGTITFAPEPQFTGAAVTDYSVADSDGNTARATVTVTVTPVTPAAVNDTENTAFDTPVTIPVLDNDVPGQAAGTDVPLVPASVVFTDPAATDGGKKLVTADGTWLIDPATGEVTFTPKAGFAGPTTPVTYQVKDENGTATTATVTVNVGDGPVALDDANTTKQGQPVTTTVLTNDSPGTGGDTPATLVPGSVRLVDPATGDEVATLTLPGVGTWTVESDGRITLAPVGSLTTPTSINYVVKDTDGNKASATLVITITTITPTAEPDSDKTPYLTPVTLDVLTNDAGGDTTAPLVPKTLKLVDGTALVDVLTVTGVGEWKVVSGELVFTPAAGFTGPTPQVGYSVADSNGTRVTSTATVEVGTPPTAAPDQGTTLQGQPTVVALLTNDEPGSGVDGSTTLVAGSVVFTSPDATNNGKTLVVSGEGTWTVNPDGTVGFAPEAAFVGTTSPVDYRVSDTDDNTATSVVTVVVSGVTPMAAPDSRNTPFGDPVTVPVLGNDDAGDPTAPLVPSSVVFTSPDATDNGKTLVVPGEGTWRVQPDGSVTFTPLPSYSGTTAAVDYRVKDTNGTPASSTVQVIVGAPPVANPDQTTTLQGQPVDLVVVGNDRPGTGVDGSTTLVVGSVVFTSPDASDGGKKLVVAGEGTWTIGADDVVTFAPEPDFTGTTTPVDYRVTDSDDNTATSTATVVITPVVPTAVADTDRTPYLTPVTVDVLTNDTPGDPVVPLVPGSVVFTDPAATDGGKRLVVPGEGTWTVDPTTGEVTFAPASGFDGDATTGYKVADENGTFAQASVTITVGTPPKAVDDATTTPQNVTVTHDVAGNDVPGSGVDGTTTIVADSVRLLEAGSPVTTVTTADGTWTVDTATGAVTFDPVPSFSGVTSVDYRVTDSDGNTATATFTVTVTAITPVAKDDEETTPFNTPVDLHVDANDVPGASTAQLVPATVTFTSAAATNGGTSLSTAEGTWQVDAAGVVTFTPATGWVGTTAPVEYSIEDSNGTTARANITVIVELPALPSIADDSDTTFQNENVTLPVLGNDNAAPGATLDPTTVVIVTTGATDGGKTLVVPGEGAWTVNTDGTITFDPEPAFTGEATPIVYSVEDNYGQAQQAQVVVTVKPITPTANDDLTTSVPFGNPATVPVLGNDTPGRPSAPLDPSSVTFTSPDATDGGKTLVVPGEGTWTVNPDGTVTFTPADGFSGVSTPVTYQVRDTNGTPDTAQVGVTVRSRPVAEPESTTTKQDINVTLTPLSNDTPGGGADWDATSVKLHDAVNNAWVTTLTVDQVGTWTVAADGTVTFDPVPTYTGTTTVSYQVTDTDGGVARSTMTVEVTPIVPAPVKDEANTPYLTPVTVPVLDNDRPGDPSAPIEKVDLVDPTTGDPVGTVTVPGVGTWTVTPDHEVRFTPEPGFEGPTTITYQVTDENGTTSTTTVTVTVGTAPTAQPDRGTELQGFPVTVAVLDNDEPGSGGDTPATLDATSVVFTSPDATDGGKTLVVDGEGTWTVNTDGTVTFTPEPQFTGTSTPVTYQVKDSDGNSATSTVTAELTPVTPQAVADSARTPARTPVTLPVLANDTAGDVRVPLVADTLTLLNGSGDPVDTLTVPGEGTWTVTSDHKLTFSPEADFAGVTTPVTYQVEDKNGTPTTAQATVTVGAAPIAKPDQDTTLQGQPVTVDLVGNDKPGGGGDTPATLVKDSVRLWDEANQAWATTVTVPSQGTWTVNVGAEGNVEFAPEKTFTGTASLPYRVSDSDTNTAASTVTVVVTPVTPAASNDPASTPYLTPVTVPVLANDTAGDPVVPLVPSTVKLIDPTTGDEVTTVTLPGVGSWQVTPDHQVRFTPEDGFDGTTTITYVVRDENGTPTRAQIPVTVGTPPTAQPDRATAASGQNASVDLLANDRPGSGDGTTPTTLVPSSVVFTSPDATDGGKTLVVPGEGTWTIDDNGHATFDPEPAFDGDTTPVGYEVTDTDGNTAASTVTATITLVPPTAAPDAARTPYATAVTVPVLTNDTPGDPEVPLVPDSVRLVDPATGDPVKELTVPGEGTWRVTETGTVVFTPEKGFTGPTTPVTYQVSDVNAQVVTSQINVTVGAPPAASPDRATTAQGTPVTINPLENDTPGSGTGSGTTWDPSSVVIIDPASGDPVKELVVPGEGTWTVNPDGTITFTPEPTFSGEATPITYEVTDTDGNTASSTVQVVVAAVVPLARDDHQETPEATPVNLDTLSNDEGGVYTPAQAKKLSKKVLARSEVLANGDVLVPLVPGTLRLLDAAGKPVTSTEVAGEGSWEVVNHDIVFTPVKGFHGLTSKQPYEVRDENGTPASANETVIVPQAEEPPAPQPPTPQPPSGPGWLPNTGGPGFGLLAGGLGLLLAGVWVLRRRRHEA